LRDRLVLSIDESAIAYVRGSVFTASGRSAPGVRVELFRVNANGSERKIEERITSEETGQFAFRLSPESGKYLVVAKPRGIEPVRGEVINIDGPAIYRTAISLPPLVK